MDCRRTSLSAIPLHTSFKSKLKIYLFSSALRWTTDLLFLSSLFHQPTTGNAYICSVCVWGGGGEGGPQVWFSSHELSVSSKIGICSCLYKNVFGPAKSNVMEETWKTQNPLYTALITDCQLQVPPKPPTKKREKKKKRRTNKKIKSRKLLFCICYLEIGVWGQGFSGGELCIKLYVWLDGCEEY